jgi:hypothetical protein
MLDGATTNGEFATRLVGLEREKEGGQEEFASFCASGGPCALLLLPFPSDIPEAYLCTCCTSTIPTGSIGAG